MSDLIFKEYDKKNELLELESMGDNVISELKQEEVDDVCKDIEEIKEIFSLLQDEVSKQGEQLELIESEMEESNIHVDIGCNNLVEANNYNSNRLKMVALVGLGCVTPVVGITIGLKGALISALGSGIFYYTN